MKFLPNMELSSNKETIGFRKKSEAALHVESASALHFKISQCRKIIVRRTSKNISVVLGEMNYNWETATEKCILEKGTSFRTVNPKNIRIGLKVNSKKLTDASAMNIRSWWHGTHWSLIALWSISLSFWLVY